MSQKKRSEERERRQTTPVRRIALPLAVLLAAVTYVSGCGSGGSLVSVPAGTSAGTGASAPVGRAVFTVTWPPRTASGRLIPVESNSIRVDVMQAGATVISKSLVRPYATAAPGTGATPVTSSIDFDALPVGDYIVIATAFPSVDGSGVAQASGGVATTVTAGTITDFSLKMRSTIQYLTIAAQDTSATLPASLTIGQSLPLTALARDASGNPVIADLQWTALDPATSAASDVASVDASGTVTALATGTAIIRVKDPESGKAGVTSVTVAPPTPTPLPTGNLHGTVN